MFGFFVDPTYLFVVMIPATVLMMIAQAWVNSTYRRWGQRRNARGITGVEAARQLLMGGGLSEVNLEGAGGRLSDHYDPRRKILRLSAGVAQTDSVASLAIVAHEIGHALQHREGYGPMRIRAALVPAAQVGSYLGYILIIIGLVLNILDLAWLGVLAFAAGAAFALATIPVELNASTRARALLTQSGLITTQEERRGVGAVLNAAAFTYVAALAGALLQLLYYASLVAGRGRRR